ncbi:MAG: hypothetical protein ABIR47_16960 [Candidatus Kapaibacterium sp.]
MMIEAAVIDILREHRASLIAQVDALDVVIGMMINDRQARPFSHLFSTPEGERTIRGEWTSITSSDSATATDPEALTSEESTASVGFDEISAAITQMTAESPALSAYKQSLQIDRRICVRCRYEEGAGTRSWLDREICQPCANELLESGAPWPTSGHRQAATDKRIRPKVPP